MTVEKIGYRVDGRNFIGTLVYDEQTSGNLPLMLVAPNWLGVTQDAIARTQKMAGRTHVGFVVDMYGEGKVSAGPPEAAQLANALRADPKERRLRMMAALSAFVAESERRGIGDASRKSAVGFCFGGGNVLELARAGADLQAAICLHGDLTTTLPAKPGEIRAALLVAHGAADPVAPKAHRDAFEAEMEAAQANWRMLTFGGLLHSFCESESHVPGVAKYNAPAARQCFRLIEEFVADAFAGQL